MGSTEKSFSASSKSLPRRRRVEIRSPRRLSANAGEALGNILQESHSPSSRYGARNFRRGYPFRSRRVRQCDGDVESIRILLAERSSATKARTASINQIHGLLVSAPEAVRQNFRRFDGAKLAVTLARTRPAPGTNPEVIARASAKRLAQRHQALTADIAHINQQLTVLAVRQNPALMAASGVGPFVAAHLLATAADNRHHIAPKDQFAALCGVAPIPASSGTWQRFRLSRGGDRKASVAVHRIVLLRKHHKEPRTAYIARRTAEGLSDRDIVRCLKRHVANEIFALLEVAFSA
ncbi:transposase [Cryobacterium sp. Hb1]|uniref:transposase n=1 Tax=Cryobacterium sp. Hb1 TaxID=1259147 RepID=UPI003519E699